MPIAEHELPEGFSFAFFKKGDGRAWADIEHSVLEFSSRKDAYKYFKDRYMKHGEEPGRRCIFIEDPDGRKVATLTIWWEYIGIRRYPWVSWVGVKPGYQGNGLGKALVARGMKLLLEIEGDVETYLKTQTWSYKAVNIYRAQGFEFVREKLNSDWDIEDYDKMISVIKNKLR